MWVVVGGRCVHCSQKFPETSGCDWGPPTGLLSHLAGFYGNKECLCDSVKTAVFGSVLDVKTSETALVPVGFLEEEMEEVVEAAVAVLEKTRENRKTTDPDA